MARVEADREDLLSEAVALVRRMEIRTHGGDFEIIAGFRATGWLSIYFGPDLMYQFDELGRLRRAFVDGTLYRTQGTALAELQKHRTETETVLVRRDLAGEPLAEFQKRVHAKIGWLQDVFHKGEATIIRQIPLDDRSLVNDVRVCLETILNTPEFLAPAIKR